MMGWMKELKACTRDNCTRYDCSYGHYHDGKLVWTKWQKKWQRMARHYSRTGEFLPEETEERRSGALGGGDGFAPTPAASAEANTEKQRKEDLGERLFPLVQTALKEGSEDADWDAMYGNIATISAHKITGMLLDGYAPDYDQLDELIADDKAHGKKLGKAVSDACDVLAAHWKKNNKTSTPVPAPEPKPEAKPEDLWAEIARLNALLDTSNHKIGFLEYQLRTAERQTQDALSVVRLMASSKPPQG